MEISELTADYNTRRMDRDLERTSKMRHPPRPEPPLFARGEAAHAEQRDERKSEEYSSARRADTEDAAKQTDAEVARNIVVALDSLQGTFYSHTTPEERARVRRATCPPSTPQAFYTDPVFSLAVTFLLALVAGALSARSTATPFRGAQLDCRNAVERMVRFA
jgi:hypothetical protein